MDWGVEQGVQDSSVHAIMSHLCRSYHTCADDGPPIPLISQGFANESKSKSNVGPWILPFAAAYAAVAVAKVVAGGAKGRNSS